MNKLFKSNWAPSHTNCCTSIWRIQWSSWVTFIFIKKFCFWIIPFIVIIMSKMYKSFSHYHLNDDNLSEIIYLNVGGQRFCTSKQTLTSIGETFFTSLLSGRISSMRDATGAIFVDRDPNLFAIILNYMRTRQLINVDTNNLTLLQSKLCVVQLHFTIHNKILFLSIIIDPVYRITRSYL